MYRDATGVTAVRGCAHNHPMATATRTRASTSTLAVVTGLVVLVDWATKTLASAALDDRTVGLGSVLTLRLSHNSGVAFGLGDRLPDAAVIAFTAGATLLLAIAAVRGVFPSPAAAGLLLGGAVANLGDRLLGGSVVDFLDAGWWPSFNLADVALTIGCVLIVIASWRTPADAPA